MIRAMPDNNVNGVNCNTPCSADHMAQHWRAGDGVHDLWQARAHSSALAGGKDDGFCFHGRSLGISIAVNPNRLLNKKRVAISHPLLVLLLTQKFLRREIVTFSSSCESAAAYASVRMRQPVGQQRASSLFRCSGWSSRGRQLAGLRQRQLHPDRQRVPLCLQEC